MKILDVNNPGFKKEFEEILTRGKMDIANVEEIVKNIINEVKKEGNKALFRHIAKFDKWEPKSDEDLEITKDEILEEIV